MTSESSTIMEAMADAAARRRPTAIYGLADRAFHAIATQILTGVHGQGTRLREADLVADLGMSRTPIREAIQRLEQVGLVEVRPSRFTVVTPVTEESAVATREFAALFAGNIARLAARRLDDAARGEAIGLAEAAIAGLTSPQSRFRTQVALFGFLADHAGNEFLGSLLGDSWYLILRNLGARPNAEEAQDGCAEALQRLAASLRSADAEESERAARAIFGMV